jgi:hypothetical protein
VSYKLFVEKSKTKRHFSDIWGGELLIVAGKRGRIRLGCFCWVRYVVFFVVRVGYF